MTLRPRAVSPWLAVAALYLAVAGLTEARFQGDTVDYARHAAEFDLGAWELGHLWWAPLGQALAAAGGGPVEPAAALAFVVINLASGLACALLLFALLRRLDVGPGVALATTGALLGSQALLNYLHSGCSYVPGLAMLELALYLAAVAGRRDGRVWPFALGAGAALGGAACFWFPYVLTVPAVILTPVVFGERGWRGRVRASLIVTVGLGSLAGLAFGGAAVSRGITDLAGLRAWLASSSHGIETGGLARALFGLARSFISMGEDGVMFKRFLLKDPYNPVTLTDLVTLGLWKLVLFYLALGALLVGLGRAPATRKALLLLAAGGGPVFAFGVYWQGGDMERYLPLYPFAGVALAALWGDPGGWRVAKVVPAVFFTAAVVVNGHAYSRWQVAAYQRGLAARVEGLAGRLPPGSVVLVVRDQLKLLPRDFLFAPEARALPIYEIATPGQAATPEWRRDVAERALAAWAAGGEVWLSRRLFAGAPHPSGTWAEGDDPRVRWADIQAFFRPLAADEEVGGADGFVRLRRGEENARALREAVAAGRGD